MWHFRLRLPNVQREIITKFPACGRFRESFKARPQSTHSKLIGAFSQFYELAIDSKTMDRLGGKKDMARVAEILTKVKNFEKAAEVYIQSQEVSEAVLLFVRMGETDEVLDERCVFQR